MAFYNTRRPHSSRRANAQSCISQPVVTNPGGGITERKIHLINGSKLFKLTEPALHKGASKLTQKSTRFSVINMHR